MPTIFVALAELRGGGGGGGAQQQGRKKKKKNTTPKGPPHITKAEKLIFDKL
ncbi:hypothetical protein ABID58_002471, partial [Bradyrhizobium sp. S3.2.6]